MGDQLREHLQREITRKEFLQLLAGLALSVLGIHNFLNALSHGLNRRSSGSNSTSRHGFGSSKFGV